MISTIGSKFFPAAIRCAAAGVVFIALVGCSRKETVPGANPAKAAVSVSVESPAESAPPPPAPNSQPAENNADAGAPATDAVPPDRGAANAKQQELLDEVFAAYRSHYADKLHYARDLDELVKTGYLKKKPVPPPGKKFVLDPKNFNVYLVPTP